MSDPRPVSYRFYEFIDILRDAGVFISTEEVLTLFRAFEHTSVDNRTVFKQTLRTTLVKEYTDIPVFDRCFEEYFEGKAPGMGMEKPLPEGMDDEGIHMLEESFESFLDEMEENLFLERTAEEIISLFLDQMIESGSSGGFGMMMFQATRSALTMGRGQGQKGSGEEEGDGAEITDMLRSLLEQKRTRRTIGKNIQRREDYLLNRFIYQLTAEEVKEMRELIRRFGQKLRNRISLRKKRMKHGGIDIKRTLRTSLQYGGVPFKIFSKDRKIDRPQLLVLCDVSGSVNQYSRFMLLLTHTLQSLFSKVRTFAFISNMVEITPLFMEMDPERAISTIFTDTNFTYGWGTNYGRCFDMFVQNFSDSLNRKTTILILGDARNNNQDAGLASFVTMYERCRNIFWLNPERKHLWNWSDSIAGVYQPYCDEMKEVNNFIDLSEFIDRLFVDV